MSALSGSIHAADPSPPAAAVKPVDPRADAIDDHLDEPPEGTA
ncbi:MAG: hypothetical protein WD834_03215 [Actinomycetota bacterium]